MFRPIRSELFYICAHQLHVEPLAAAEILYFPGSMFVNRKVPELSVCVCRTSLGNITELVHSQ